MRKLFGLAALGGIGLALRKLVARKANPAVIDTDNPQKTVQRVESAVGEPVRP